MSGLAFAFGAAACVAGGLSGCFGYTVHHERKEKARRRVAAYGDQTASAHRLASSGGRSWGLRYAEGLTRRLFTAATEPIAPSVRQKRSGETRYGMKFLARSAKAGCGKDITVSAYCEAGARLMLAGALAGCLFGALFSIQMSGRLLPEAPFHAPKGRQSPGGFEIWKSASTRDAAVIL